MASSSFSASLSAISSAARLPISEHRKLYAHGSQLSFPFINSFKSVQLTIPTRHLSQALGRFGGLYKASRTILNTICRVVEIERSAIETSLCECLDVVILSNGPGEVATWVKPVVSALRRHFNNNLFSLRISVILATCPHASGKEKDLVQSYKEVDRCQGPENVWSLVLFGCSDRSWDWHKRGVCIFLGGDQFFALLFGRRLGFKTIVYAEEHVRWLGFADMYLLRNQELMEKIPSWARRRCEVVGELLLDAVASSDNSHGSTTNFCDQNCKIDATNVKQFTIVGLLPGSKPVKLAIGIPYFITVAENMHTRCIGQDKVRGSLRFILPLAPTLTLDMLAKHADPDRNPFISRFNWSCGRVVVHPEAQDCTFLKGNSVGLLVTKGGVNIEICQEFPSYHLFKQCTLCLTTVGANTAELGYLGIPMIVVLPTHALEVFKGAVGGVLGILTSTPGWIGDILAKVANAAILRSVGFVAWPNRWAEREVVPELVGKIEPEEVAALAALHLEDRDKLQVMHETLIHLRQKQQTLFDESEGVRVLAGGAADLVASTVKKLLSNDMN